MKIAYTIFNDHWTTTSTFYSLY